MACIRYRLELTSFGLERVRTRPQKRSRSKPHQVNAMETITCRTTWHGTCGHPPENVIQPLAHLIWLMRARESPPYISRQCFYEKPSTTTNIIFNSGYRAGIGSCRRVLHFIASSIIPAMLRYICSPEHARSYTQAHLSMQEPREAHILCASRVTYKHW